MAYSATLHIEGHPKEQDGLNVISCDFAFHQKTDANGQPTSHVSGGVINLSLLNENDYDIFSWAFAHTGKKNGKIVIASDLSDNQAFQTIKFVDGILIDLIQNFSYDSQVIVNLTISARQIEISGATFMNIWDTSDG